MKGVEGGGHEGGLFKLVDEAEDEDEGDERGQDVAAIDAQCVRELRAAAGVSFGEEVLPAPAEAVRTVEREGDAAKGQDQVRDEEVFEIENAGRAAERVETAPDVEAEDAREREEVEESTGENCRGATRPIEVVDEAGDDVFEDSDDGGKRRARHEDEEERAPETAKRHVVEDVRESRKNKAWTLVGMDAVGKASGDDDEARGDGDERVEDADVEGFAEERAVAADVAAEDRHGTNADREREEGVIHGFGDDLDDADRFHTCEVGDEIKGETFESGIMGIKVDGVDGENHNQNEEAQHEPFRNAFDALLESDGADDCRGNSDDSHGDAHGEWVAEHTNKGSADAFWCEARKSAAAHADKVDEHPACDGRIEHHEEEVAEEADDAVDAPGFLGGRQSFVKASDGTLRAAARGEFHEKRGQTDEGERNKIERDKCATAVLPCDVREAPNVAETNRTACGKKDEADAACEFFTIRIRVHN